MGKFVNSSILDAALAKFGTADLMSVCDAEPATYANAITDVNTAGGNQLASVVPTFGAITNGVAAGSRRRSCNVQIGVAINAGLAGTGTATHIVLTESVGSTILLITVILTPPALVGVGSIDIGAWEYQIDAVTQ